MSIAYTESELEKAALAWFESIGYAVLNGPQIAPGEPAAERTAYNQVVLERRLIESLRRFNPGIPTSAIDDAFWKLIHPNSPSLVENNRTIHKYITSGVPVEYQRPDGSICGDLVRIFDYDEPENNDFVAVNQFTVVEDKQERRPDIVIFVNGLPLAVIELKNPADEEADIWRAFNQLQTYKHQIPSLFVYNEAMVISDGSKARVGTITADREWYLPWRTIEGDQTSPDLLPQIQVMILGMFDKDRFLDMIRHFILFEDYGDGKPIKKMAGYHQYAAVNCALDRTEIACNVKGDRKIGVIWHTQGSGKSLTMAFFAARLVQHPAMANPTIVMVTDRNDLDNQLFGTFSRCSDILRQKPIQAENRSHLRSLLRTESGGIIFTTIQKFLTFDSEDKHPQLSDRTNIVVIADEAHRSQYDFLEGHALRMREALPNASFVGFTGTPIELRDKNTRFVFGDYISIYDIERAVRDGATVTIFYESRLARLSLNEAEKPKIDADFDEVTECEEVEHKEMLKSKWAQLESVVGAEKRIAQIAQDIVTHFETRLEAMQGKAMIVCMSRRICVDLYKAIAKIRPSWHNAEDGKGMLKIVMTGSAADPLEWQDHIRNKQKREDLAKRFKDPNDPFQVAIVRDMWLTGFDVPCLHTMYVDKPMRGHGLMQAIARVNRVFKDKPGGLVVDYIGLADHLKYALANYTENGGKGETAIYQEKAVELLQEAYENCCEMFMGFDWSKWKSRDSAERLQTITAAQDFVLKQNEGKKRFFQFITALSSSFALAVPHEYALQIREDVIFFQTVKAVLAKSLHGNRPETDALEQAIRQIVSRAITSDEVIDVFAASGLNKPNISILSDEFLAEVRGLSYKSLSVEMLRKILEGEIRILSKKNLVLSRTFSEMLESIITKYMNRTVETVKVIEEMIELAKEMREASKRGEKLKLNEDELAFYDALEVNDSAVKILGDDSLRTIARELADSIRNNVTIDWSIRESVRAKMRVHIKRILKKYGYPPDKQAKATDIVLEQAALMCKEWVAA